MGTTTHGLPWPEPTAPVRDGAAAVKALAEMVDKQHPATIRTGQVNISTDATGYFRLRFTDMMVTGIVVQLWQAGINLGWNCALVAFEGSGGGFVSGTVHQITTAAHAVQANSAIQGYWIAWGTQV